MTNNDRRQESCMIRQTGLKKKTKAREQREYKELQFKTFSEIENICNHIIKQTVSLITSNHMAHSLKRFGLKTLSS